MSNTGDDFAYERAMDALHNEAMLERAAQEQAIIIFVEGASEEAAFPILLMDLTDSGNIGLKIANYQGNGSLVAFLRLMVKTLRHPYPIIVTHDNDPESNAAIDRCRAQGLINNKVFIFPIPSTPVVQYPNGTWGGSFEEAFASDSFIDAVFSESVLPAAVVSKQDEFRAVFDVRKPWLTQLERFCADHGFIEWALKKPLLAERLAEGVGPGLPETFAKLIALISEIRKNAPIIHPTDVEF